MLELMAVTWRSDCTKFRQQVLNPLLTDDLIEMTVPDNPTSSLQKYRITEWWKSILESAKPEGEKS